MNEASSLLSAMLAGAAIGSAFFGGLWWTTRFGLSSKRPAAWFLGSAMLRTSIAAAGFCCVARGDWRSAVACLLGFLAARGGTLWLTRTARVCAP